MLDTWFSSALWPFATLGWPDETPELRAFYPTDVLSTARDILFLWVARMVMMGLRFAGDIPFTDVYVHSVIQAPDGRRMSKSLGTGIDPLEEIDEHGADAVRFGLLAMSSTQDVRYSSEKVEQGQALANKLFNASRFVLLNVQPRASSAAPRPTTVEDRWILSRLQRVDRRHVAADRRVRVRQGALGLYDFVYGELCDWYLELVKGREFDADLSATLLHVLRETLALAHPVIPFVTEEIWDVRARRPTGLLAGSPFPQADAALLDERGRGADRRRHRGRHARCARWRNERGRRRRARVLPARLARRRATTDTAPLVARLARLDLEAGAADDADAVASGARPRRRRRAAAGAGVDPAGAGSAGRARAAPSSGRDHARRGQARQRGLRRQGAAGARARPSAGSSSGCARSSPPSRRAR